MQKKDDLITKLAAQFQNINTQIDIIHNQTINEKFTTLEQSIKQENCKQISNGLNNARTIYLKSLDKSLKSILNDLNKLKQKSDEILATNRLIQFIPNRSNTFTNETILNLILNSINQNYLFTKLKYFNLFNFSLFKEIELRDQTPNQSYFKCKKLFLSNKLMFYFVEFQKRMCYMQIKTITNIELFRSRNIHLKQFEQYDFIGYGSRVCGLFHDDDTFTLKLFDTKLNLVKIRQFSFRLTLHSMNSNDIICYTNNKMSRYLVLDYNFDRKFSFGQKELANKPYYLGDSSLIQITALNIYAYFYDIKTEQHYLKIISRPFGSLERSVQLGSKNSIKSSLIKLDPGGSILIKLNNLNLIKVLDLNGAFLFETKHALFDTFKTIDLNKENDLFYFEKNKKLYVI